MLRERLYDEAGELTPESPLFVSNSNRNLGQRLGYEGIYKLSQELAKQAGCPEIHPHRGRHTYINDLVMMGMDANLAMQLSRNSSVKMFRHYSKQVLYEAAKQRYL